jgi:hypothetical protein
VIAMNDLPDAIDRLTERIEALERRVGALEPRIAALEHPLTAPGTQTSTETKALSANPAVAKAALPTTRPSNLFPVLGRAMLGIAGAYLLRAVEEARSLPRSVVALAGLAYAFLWLALAARARGGPRLASTIYACTAALILGPMLWELTLRFDILTPTMSAVVLCAFALAATGLAWKNNHAALLRVATISCAGLTLALAIASHALAPFVAALLILVTLCEFASPFDRVPEVRAVAALTADAAIWILIFVYFNPQNAREDYPLLSRTALLTPGIVLFLLYAAVVIFRTVLCAKRITAFEAMQTTIAFVLAAVSLADFGPSNGPILLGAICLLLTAASYTAVFTVFGRASERRNAAVFSAWSAALLLAGSFLCLSPLPMTLVLSAGALAAVVVSRRGGGLPFASYGLVFLVAAAATAGLPIFLAAVWIRTPPGALDLSILLATLCAILCYGVNKPDAGESWPAQALLLAYVALAAAAAAALVVEGLVALVACMAIPGAHHLAFIRTLTLCVATLALVFGGAHWQRLELTRLGYAAMGLVAIKLVFEDMRHGHLAFLAASIFLVALTLIAAPRVARVRLKV